MDPSFFEMLENFIATVRQNFQIFTNTVPDLEYFDGRLPSPDLHHLPSPDLVPITIQNEQTQNKGRQGQPSLQDKRNEMIEAQRQQRMVDMLGPGNYILPSRGGPKPAPQIPVPQPSNPRDFYVPPRQNEKGRGSKEEPAVPSPRPQQPRSPSIPARPSMSDQFLTRYERDVQDGKVKAPSPAMSPPPVMKPKPTPTPKPATKKVRAV